MIKRNYWIKWLEIKYFWKPQVKFNFKCHEQSWRSIDTNHVKDLLLLQVESSSDFTVSENGI